MSNAPRYRLKLENNCKDVPSKNDCQRHISDSCTWRSATSKQNAKVYRSASCVASANRATRPISFEEVEKLHGQPSMTILHSPGKNSRGYRNYRPYTHSTTFATFGSDEKRGAGQQPPLQQPPIRRQSTTFLMENQPPPQRSMVVEKKQIVLPFHIPSLEERRKELNKLRESKDKRLEDFGKQVGGDVDKCMNPMFDDIRPYYAQDLADEFEKEIPGEFYSDRRRLCESMKLIDDLENTSTGQRRTSQYRRSLANRISDSDVKNWWLSQNEDEDDEKTVDPDFAQFEFDMADDVKKCASSDDDSTRSQYARYLASNRNFNIKNDFFSNPRKLCQAIKLMKDLNGGFQQDLDNSEVDVQDWWKNRFSQSAF
jgi:hypothetical protein